MRCCDMRVAGRAPEIGLATVAEIQNAKDVPEAVNRVRAVEGSGQAIALSGVWRIWPDHGGDNSQDGEFISAQIYSPEEELLVHDRRIGFVAGTAPDEKQRMVKVGECILVLGIPRVDLALVSWRIRHGGDALRWSLPYEIIVVGVYDDEPKECGDE